MQNSAQKTRIQGEQKFVLYCISLILSINISLKQLYVFNILYRLSPVLSADLDAVGSWTEDRGYKDKEYILVVVKLNVFVDGVKSLQLKKLVGDSKTWSPSPLLAKWYPWLAS